MACTFDLLSIPSYLLSSVLTLVQKICCYFMSLPSSFQTRGCCFFPSGWAVWKTVLGWFCLRSVATGTLFWHLCAALFELWHRFIVGGKVCLGFPVASYGKTWMNFFGQLNTSMDEFLLVCRLRGGRRASLGPSLLSLLAGVIGARSLTSQWRSCAFLQRTMSGSERLP